MSRDYAPARELEWPRQLAQEAVETRVDLAVWVPDKRLDPVAIALREAGIPVRTLTREEECVGYSAGYRAAGGMPLILFQCSGLGNALNALGSLAVPYGLGFPIVLSMRGTLGERNPAQVTLGRATPTILASLGIQSFSVRNSESVRTTLRGIVALATSARQVAALLLEPELDA